MSEPHTRHSAEERYRDLIHLLNQRYRPRQLLPGRSKFSLR